MLEHASSSTFAPLVGQVFHAVLRSGGSCDLVLSECREIRGASAPGSTDAGGPGPRTPFALLFHARDEGFFEQQTVTLDHPALGEFPVFLVPVGSDRDGMAYEAVFG